MHPYGRFTFHNPVAWVAAPPTAMPLQAVGTALSAPLLHAIRGVTSLSVSTQTAKSASHCVCVCGLVQVPNVAPHMPATRTAGAHIHDIISIRSAVLRLVRESGGIGARKRAASTKDRPDFTQAFLLPVEVLPSDPYGRTAILEAAWLVAHRCVDFRCKVDSAVPLQVSAHPLHLMEITHMSTTVWVCIDLWWLPRSAHDSSV
jgi:hypothetical protein